MQVKDTVRLSKTSQQTLLQYATDVNQAIRVMENSIQELARDMEKNKAIADALQKTQLENVKQTHWTSDGSLSQHNEVFWRKMKETIISAFHEIQR